MRLFDIRDLTKVYRMGEVEVHAIRQVTLTLDQGQFVVLLGPSGSGKSRLLNILGGLDVSTSGQVFYRNTELTQEDDAALTDYRRCWIRARAPSSPPAWRRRGRPSVRPRRSVTARPRH